MIKGLITNGIINFCSDVVYQQRISHRGLFQWPLMAVTMQMASVFPHQREVLKKCVKSQHAVKFDLQHQSESHQHLMEGILMSIVYLCLLTKCDYCGLLSCSQKTGMHGKEETFGHRSAFTLILCNMQLTL